MRVANCSHQRAPKLGRIQQVTEFHYLVCHVLCHCSSSLPEQANQQHTLTLCWVPPSSEFTVLLHQSSGNTVLMSPCTRSTDPAVVTRTSSEVILPQEVILLDATTAPERSSPSFPFLLSVPCIMYLFFHISLYLDCLSNEIYDLSCSHKIAMPAQGKE